MGDVLREVRSVSERTTTRPILAKTRNDRSTGDVSFRSAPQRSLDLIAHVQRLQQEPTEPPRESWRLVGLS